MVTVTEMMIAIGVPVCVVENKLLGRGLKKRGRPPKNRKEINIAEWTSKKKAIKMLAIDSADITSLIGSGDLSVIVYKQKLLISIESINKYREKFPLLNSKPVPKRNKGRPRKKETYSLQQVILLPPPMSTPVLLEKAHPVNQGTNNGSGNKIFIKITEYAPGQWGYEVNDVAIAFKRHPDSIRNLVSGHKVKGKPIGDKCYIFPQSLKDWLKRMSDLNKQGTT